MLKGHATHPKPFSTNVKKVILTGSIAAVLELGREEKKHYTENDWNEVSVKTVEEKGADAGAVVIYIASKTLAEKGKYWSLPVQVPLSLVAPSRLGVLCQTQE